MASKVFLDANILLDFTLKREAYHVSRSIIELVVSRRVQGYVTPSIVHIMGYWLRKAYGKATAKELIIALLADIHVIDTSHDTVVSALHSKIDDIEDALQYFTAIHHGMDFFISQDKVLKKCATPILPVYSPDDFLKKYV